MKFYLCALPLGLLLVLLAIFPRSCDGQYRRQQPGMNNPHHNERPMLRGNNPNKGTCLIRGRTYRAGAKIVMNMNCELCTCLADGSKQCNPLNCMHCERYPSLHTNPCCNHCRNMRRQPGEFDFQGGVFGEDRKVGEPHLQGSPNGSPDEINDTNE